MRPFPTLQHTTWREYHVARLKGIGKDTGGLSTTIKRMLGNSSVSRLLTEKHGPEMDFPDEVPFHQDITQYGVLVSRFIRDFLDGYYPDDAAVAEDSEGSGTELQAFWDAIYAPPNVRWTKPAINRALLYDYLETLIVGVTMMHNQVGNVAELMSDPQCGGSKIRAGDTMADFQQCIQGLNIALATAFQMPLLMSNFDHVLRNDSTLNRTRSAWRDFHDGLRVMQKDVNDRNRKRGAQFEVKAFDIGVLLPSICI